MLCKVYKVPMSAPDDISGVKKLLTKGEFKAEDIVAFIGKTEGNGCVNDFTRGFTTFTLQTLLSEELGISREQVSEKMVFVMSGGCEGVMSPHVTVFVKEEKETKVIKKKKRLSIGVCHTRNFLPEELGTIVQAKEVAKGVIKAIKQAKIDNFDDVHFVQIKCPLLTNEKIMEAKKRNKIVVTTDTYKSMGYSRGASALGVALALREIDKDKLNNDVICKEWNLYSKVASASAGIELLNCEIIVLGNSKEAEGDLIIGHSMMKDSIDSEAVVKALKNVGINSEEELLRVVNVFAKAEADPTGNVRNRRNTMLTDSDFNHTRHARAVVNAVISSIIGDPMNYVSGGAEHQGPAGGGPIAIIARVNRN